MSKCHCYQAFILYLKILDDNAEGAYKPSQGILPQLFFFPTLCYLEIAESVCQIQGITVKKRKGTKRRFKDHFKKTSLFCVIPDPDPPHLGVLHHL